MCASFEIAAALAREHVAGNPPLRIEGATPLAQMLVWVYDYGKDAWVERK